MQDCAWDEPRSPVEIICDFDAGEYVLGVAEEVFTSEVAYAEAERGYRNEGGVTPQTCESRNAV